MQAKHLSCPSPLATAPSLWRFLLIATCALGAWTLNLSAAVDVRSAGLKGDGKTDDTAALQAALDAGKTDLNFPAGEYLLGPINIPADSRITFDPRARITVAADKMAYTEEVETDGKKRKVSKKYPLFTIAGDRVRLEGLRFDFSKDGAPVVFPVNTLVFARNVSDATVSGFHVFVSSKAEKKRGTRFVLFEAENSSNIVMENSGAKGISLMLYTLQCSNVTSRGNWMIGGAALTTFAFGSKGVRHHDNWSRNVGYQCVWRGGSPDPSRKAPKVPLGTANVVNRETNQEDPGFVPHTRGVFDVMVQNNYAEYGTVLCWGNKARQVVVDGNISRFMWDYAYGSEGDENTIYSNNISINSAVAGFMCLYWGEKVLITGNLCIVRHEPMNKDFTERQESTYMGQFVRLHHGPPNPEDKYGTGSVSITGNLFVNELSDRPSGISVEGGRDVMISGNKIINGLLRKSDELGRVKAEEAQKDTDEFASQQAPKADAPMAVLRRVGTDLSRVTIIGNEFISRQSGDKPAVLINGSVSNAIIKDNVFRKEASIITFTDAQKEQEKAAPRFMLYSEDNFDEKDLTNSKPATAIGIAPFTPGLTLVQGNFVYGWKAAITADNTSSGKAAFVVTGNTTDGAIAVQGPADRTMKKVEGNIEIPAGLIP